MKRLPRWLDYRRIKGCNQNGVLDKHRVIYMRLNR